MMNKIYYELILLISLLPLNKVSAREMELGGSSGLDNPLKGVGSISEFIEKILEVVVAIGIPIAILFIIYSGFLFVTAQGNEDKLKTAKKTLGWTLVGTAVLLGAWLLVDVIQGTVNSLAN